jgi:hypothetical protein
VIVPSLAFEEEEEYSNIVYHRERPGDDTTESDKA